MAVFQPARCVLSPKFANLLMNSRRPASAACELQLQLRSSIHRGRGFPIVTRVAIRIHPILIGVHGEVSVGQEREVYVDAACSPVVHRTDVPRLPVPSCYDDIISNACLEQLGFVPLGWTRPW